jgi:hypothetical protein
MGHVVIAFARKCLKGIAMAIRCGIWIAEMSWVAVDRNWGEAESGADNTGRRFLQI